MILENTYIFISDDPLEEAVLTKYYALRDLVDSHSEKTAAALGSEINCGPGCSACCILTTAASVEARVIQEYTSLHKIEAADNERCPFLSDDLCLVYPARPLICRTHGLPVMTEGEVHSCEKNFTGDSEAGAEFILDLDTVNTHLGILNLAWIKITGSGSGDGRISLSLCGWK